MKKRMKLLCAAILSVIMMMSGTTAFASEGQITPRYNNVGSCNLGFDATSGSGVASVVYNGYSGFARADVTVKVQKRFLLVIWTNVGEWSSSSTNANGYFHHVFALNGSGTYRATITLTVTGVNGTVDTITETIESSY